MKKNAFFIALTVLGGIVLSSLAMAATTASLSPASVSVAPGQSFNVAIRVDSQGVKNYTVKIELHFPTDLLEVKSFVFNGSGWMAWNLAGYDLTDNTNGVLIKTAGYPGGFGGLTTTANFGTISFMAKKSGTGEIKIATDSMMLNDSNQNVFNGVSSKVSVTVLGVATPSPTPTPPATKTPVPGQTQTVSPSPSVSPSEIVSPSPSPLAGQATILTALGNIVSLGTGNTWLGIIVVIVLAGVIYFVVKRLLRKKDTL